MRVTKSKMKSIFVKHRLQWNTESVSSERVTISVSFMNGRITIIYDAGTVIANTYMVCHMI